MSLARHLRPLSRAAGQGVLPLRSTIGARALFQSSVQSGSTHARRSPSIRRSQANAALLHSSAVRRSTVYDDFHNILDDAPRPALTVESMDDNLGTTTFSDGLVVPGASVLIDGRVFLWRPPQLDPKRAAPGGQGWEEWDQGAFHVFEVVVPKPEILLFGTGKTVLPPPARLRNYLNSLGIQLEVQDSRNAASTFNLLAEEGRRVAVALLPTNPLHIRKAAANKADEEGVIKGELGEVTSV